MRPLSARERGILAIGLLLLLLASFWLLIAVPFQSGFAERAAQRDTLRLTYQHNSRLINAIPAMRRRAERLAPMSRDYALRARNRTEAVARLRERLRSEVARAGGQLSALQEVPTGNAQVRVWAQSRITLEDLEKLLVSLNDTPPYLTIESLRISADKALETGKLEPLDVRLEASISFLSAAS